MLENCESPERYAGGISIHFCAFDSSTQTRKVIQIGHEEVEVGVRCSSKDRALALQVKKRISLWSNQQDFFHFDIVGYLADYAKT